MLDFVKTGINFVKARINGRRLPQFMWEPYTADVSGLVREGENEIELTLVNNLRNFCHTLIIYPSLFLTDTFTKQ